MRDLIRQAGPSVVRVQCPDIEQQGTGFLIRADATLLTNCHVVSAFVSTPQGDLILEYSKDIRVLYQGSEISARILHNTEATEPVFEDYAILKCDDVGEVSSLQLGSYDSVEPGDDVLVLGYPLGMRHLSATRGMVSAKPTVPSHQNALFPIRVIQVDGAINPGNSGGPLIHVSSEQVVGIVTVRLGSIEKQLEDLERLGGLGTGEAAKALLDLLRTSNQFLNPGIGHAVSIEYALRDCKNRGIL